VNAVVVDAAAIVEYLLRSARGERVRALVEDPAADLHIPALCDVEVASALRGLIRGREIDLDRAREAILDYGDLPLARHGHVPLLRRVLELRENFSAYDGTYVALAEGLTAELLTCDDALAKAVRTHARRVRLAR
jgi:predicted nucleic acid-binding protein